jgi:hypothetical protein
VWMRRVGLLLLLQVPLTWMLGHLSMRTQAVGVVGRFSTSKTTHIQSTPKEKKMPPPWYPQCLPSPSLTPCVPLIPHIKQEIWRTRRTRISSCHPPRPSYTLNRDDLDILHIGVWKFCACNKRDAGPPERQKQYYAHHAPMILEKWALPQFHSLDLVPKTTQAAACNSIELASCEMGFYHLGLESPDQNKYICNDCSCTYHWQCLLETNCYNANEREAIDTKDTWACPAST